MIPLPVSELDGLPRWVAWKNLERDGRLTKVPYSPKFGPARSDDPSTWGSRRDSVEKARTIVTEKGGGIGFMLGDLGDERAIAGLDFDSCRTPDGAFTPWASEGLTRFFTYAEISPSGTGAKAFFLYNATDLPALRKLTGTDWSKMWKQPNGGAHPPGIELHLGNRFFAWTGLKLEEGPAHLSVIPFDTMRWLIQQAGPAIAGKNQRAKHLTRTGQDTSRSAKAMAIGCKAVHAGADFSGMVGALMDAPETAEWCTEKGHADNDRELLRIFKKATADGPRLKLPDLEVQGGNLPATVKELRTILTKSGTLYDRGGIPVRLVHPAEGGLPVAHRLTPNAVVMEAHDHCRPVVISKDGDPIPVTLSERCAKMWLESRDWNLPYLKGITGAPVLTAGGGIVTADGYDAARALWCRPPPALLIPERPSRKDAVAALLKIRARFATFPFSDSPMISRDGLDVVDLSKSPDLAESCLLVGLMTAVCRPSLSLSPGLLFAAPAVSGAGSGKGKLVRAISEIAFGFKPCAFTAGHDRDELDKRLVADLIEAAPVAFLDNLNDTALKSATLASVTTENPARVRIMGVSQMVPLNSAALICITGNALTVSEDLARRFISIDLDPRCEDPEARPFKAGFLDDIARDRVELLSAVLTIWRWGRQNTIKAGLSLGGFEQWAIWCRDPLLALGCQDAVRRMRDAKANDPRRRFIADLFTAWKEHHADGPMKGADLAEPVLALLNPQRRSRQYLAQRLAGLANTRGAGFVLTQQPGAGTWGTATYALKATGNSNPIEHRTHRTHEEPASEPDAPMTPMSPMPDGVSASEEWDGEV